MNNALLGTTLHRLAGLWPAFAPVSELTAGIGAEPVAGQSSQPDKNAATLLGESLIESYVSGIVEFDVGPGLAGRAIPLRPRVTPWVRYQAQTSSHVTNLRLERVQLDDATRRLVRFLDGTRTRDELVEAVCGMVACGELRLVQDGKAVAGGQPRRTVLATVVGQRLARLQSGALLLGGGTTIRVADRAQDQYVEDC